MAKDEDGSDDAVSALEALGDKEHQEALVLYRESTDTLRFVKNHQWNTVGATLLCFLGICVIAWMAKANDALVAKLMGITIILSCSVIFTLLLYQFWTHNEMSKIDAIDARLSPFFNRIRRKKSRREGDIHRYLILTFMVFTVILGAVVVHLALDRIASF